MSTETLPVTRLLRNIGSWAPNGHLRFNGPVLEQEWREEWSGETEWRPVPQAEEAK